MHLGTLEQDQIVVILVAWLPERGSGSTGKPNSESTGKGSSENIEKENIEKENNTRGSSVIGNIIMTIINHPLEQLIVKHNN